MLRAEIKAKFKGCGITPTSQRIDIAGVLLKKPQHLSAEQIIAILAESDRKASKATVYNSLNLFAKKGLIRECLVDPERRLYDSCVEPHHHFYNLDSGELSDIPADDIEILGLPALPDGTVCDGMELFIRIRGAP